MARSTPELSQRLYLQRLAAAERQIAARLDRGSGASPFRSLRRRFVIAHAPRVGSHLLCELLAPYGARVEEFFEAPRIHAAAARHGLTDVHAYCRWLMDAQAANGIFGVSGGVKALAPLTMVRETPGFAAEWGFIFLTRGDFVARAVSELIARRSGAFKSSASPQRPVTEADYDPVRLRKLIDAAMTVNAAWEGAFAALSVTPLRLEYEALAADPAGVAARAADHLGLPPDGAVGDFTPRLRRQAGPINESWIARFRAEHAAFCRARAAGEFEPQRARRNPPLAGRAM